MVSRESIVQQVMDFIEQHYAEGISLTHVARALNYSPSHLTSVVRVETGRPVTAWIIERRISAARERLLQTDEPVAQVAEAVGFRDRAYFARQFTRASGATPGQWRARHLTPLAALAQCPTCGAHRFQSTG